MNPLDITFATLAAVDSGTVEQVLSAALWSREREIADRAVKVVLQRKPLSLLVQLVRRWDELPARWRHWLAEKPTILETAIMEVFVSEQPKLRRNAVDTALALDLYELIEFFITQVEVNPPTGRALAAEAVLVLAEKMKEGIHAPREYDHRRDPERTYHRAVGTLAIAASRFREHRTMEVVEAFLLLATRDNLTLRDILHDHTHPAHRPVVDQLLKSPRDAVKQLLVSFLEDPHPMPGTVRLAGLRRDVEYLRLLGRRLAESTSDCLDLNLERIEEVAWLKDAVAVTGTLRETEQLGILRFCSKAGLSAPNVVPLLEYLRRCGNSRVRTAAVRAWIGMHPENLRELIADFLADSSPVVRAEALRHVRSCEYPDAIPVLLAALGDESPDVREAAQASLDEFSFRNYQRNFERLSPNVRHSSGKLVRKVNPQLLEELEQELRSRHRSRRLRGMEMADALEVVPQLAETLLFLSDDEDHAVRLEAIRLLGQCESIEVRTRLALLRSASDPVVQQLAIEAWAALDEQRNVAVFRSGSATTSHAGRETLA